MSNSIEKVWARALYFFVCIIVLALLMALSACGQDSPITPDVVPTEVPTAIGLPAPERSTPFPTALATVTRPATRVANAQPSPTPSIVPVLPPCTPKEEREVSVPENFAPNFPFPPGIKFSRAENLEDNPDYVRVVGYAPISLKNAVTMLIRELPKAGYELGRGDSEANEAESTFMGNGWRGGFRLNGVQSCPGITLWMVVVIKFGI